MPTIEPEENELLLSALRNLLPSMLRYTDKQLTTKIGRGKYEDFALQVFGYLGGSCGSVLMRNQTAALLSRILECLATYIREALSLPVTINTIVNNIHLLPHSVHIQYPNYADTRMLLAIISPQILPRVGASA